MIQDDASSWFASQNQQIQDFEAPPAPEAEPLNAEPAYDPDRPFGDAPTVTDDDLRNVTNMRLAQQPTAELIVGVMDVILPLALVLLIKGTDKDDIKLEPDERETLVTAWAGWLGDKNILVFESSTFRFVVQVTWNGQSKVFLLTAFSLIKKVRES